MLASRKKVAAYAFHFSRSSRQQDLGTVFYVLCLWRSAAAMESKSAEMEAAHQACIERGHVFRQNALTAAVYHREFLCRARVFPAWVKMHTDAKQLVRSRNKQMKFALWSHTNNEKSLSCHSAHAALRSWRSHVVNMSAQVALHCRHRACQCMHFQSWLLMHWHSCAKHDLWKRKQQEVVSLLMQARVHLSESDADQQHNKERLRSLAQRAIDGLADVNIGLAVTRALVAWRGAATAIRIQRTVQQLGKEVASTRMMAHKTKHQLVEAKSNVKAANIDTMVREALLRWRLAAVHVYSVLKRERRLVTAQLRNVTHCILFFWWRQVVKVCKSTAVSRTLLNKAFIISLSELLTRWLHCALVSRDIRHVCEMNELAEDLAWYKLRDLAVAGPRLLRPLARLEAHMLLHIAFASWLRFRVGFHNIEVVKKITDDAQIGKAESSYRIQWVAAKFVALSIPLVAYAAITSWRQQLILSRMQRSLEYVRNMATTMRTQLMRRIKQNYVELMSKVVDSWRWVSEAAAQRRHAEDTLGLCAQAAHGSSGRILPCRKLLEHEDSDTQMCMLPASYVDNAHSVSQPFMSAPTPLRHSACASSPRTLMNAPPLVFRNDHIHPCRSPRR
jgi:hypothetical protein